MAFNLQTFKTRSVTALIFVVIMLAGLLWNQWSFFILFSVIHFGAWWEYLKLAEKIHQTIIHPYSKLGFMLIGYGLMLWFCDPVLRLNNYSLSDNFSIPVSGAGFSLLVIGIFQRPDVHLKSFVMAALGWLYISLSLGMMMDLYGFETLGIISPPVTKIEWLYLPLFTIICMWINDTMAYLVGSMIGKTPFSKISPKKTWEGTLGGIILAGIIVGWLGYFFDGRQAFGHSIGWWIFLAVFAAIAGTLGDLLESKLKRMAGLKDSGAIMPGHGGFLDRFDSLLIATPVVWVVVHSS